MNTRWMPHVTVAAIAVHQGRFLVVEEETEAGLKLNMPAGHLEPGESLQQAVVREVLEETARPFTPEALVGIYLASSPDKDGTPTSWLRFAFCGRVGDADPTRALDTGIVRTLWLTADELAASADRHRSPMVMAGVRDYLAGRRHALDVLCTDASALIAPARPLAPR
ncbi:NUDIX hydrolase [Comamonas serinivorans]|uniref:Phosphatase NudJ n=1 Tax=Comamonas serinivorans TaxID=1082851 RepID=A0A1Y0EK28_9BURK|nr:NUDIX hydrolase [Comamonas serinivorans]ARU03719.1 NUDIX hydrolase [Comamonas serinivorans]